MLTAKLHGSYRHKVSQNKVFRFLVSGTEKDIQAYSDAQGDNIVLDEETGKPFFFTTRYFSDNINLVITNNNQVVADDTEMAKVASLVAQFGEATARLILATQAKTASAE